jgi:hypothetical protein
MKKLTRDEFEALVTNKTPVAELPDGSDIELTMNQAIAWFEQVDSYPRPSFVLESGRWVFLGEEPNNFTHSEGLYQIGGEIKTGTNT